MAKGNDGNYLQHSAEVAVAKHLVGSSGEKTLHLALTHGMMPFEKCGDPPGGQTRRLLQEALKAARNPPMRDEAPIVTAYRKTNASLDCYPNTGELLAVTIGRNRLSGGITEVDADKYESLFDKWQGSDVTPVNASWRCEVRPGGVLSCPTTLRSPWLFSADPMTFCRDGYADDDKLYQADRARISIALQGFIARGKPGVAALFVYSVRPVVQCEFWAFADDLGEQAGTIVVTCWVTHQGGNRNLGALLYSGIPECPLPRGVNRGR